MLAKMGRDAEAKRPKLTAIYHPTASPFQIHQYGRQLLAAKKTEAALEVFKYNAERNGDAWPVHVGLARGYAAVGDTKAALEHAQKAVSQAPDELNRKSLEAWCRVCQRGRISIGSRGEVKKSGSRQRVRSDPGYYVRASLAASSCCMRQRSLSLILGRKVIHRTNQEGKHRLCYTSRTRETS